MSFQNARRAQSAEDNNEGAEGSRYVTGALNLLHPELELTEYELDLMIAAERANAISHDNWQMVSLDEYRSSIDAIRAALAIA